VREHYRLSLEDVALATCVRRAYLAGIEDMRMDQLPARPFVVGYVRAYAEALGLDPDRAAARLKMEYPDDHQPLRAPVGVAKESDRRLRPVILTCLMVVLAFIAWNVAQRAVSKSAPQRNPGTEVALSGAKAPAPAAKGPITLGAPLPPPQESTVPAPYVTPGLAPAVNPDAPVPPPAPLIPIGTPFAAHGAIYGVPAGQSVVTLQAVKSASLIIRGADGSVYFAHQLSAGEAYRAPQTPGISLEASDPAKIDVFVGGLRTGSLPSAQVVVAKLTAPPPDHP
jgi:hypothetical protein